MSTMSPHHDVADLAEKHFERWRRLHDERRFRVEQLAALEAEPPSGRRHESGNQALHMAAVAILCDIDAALARMDEGRYGLCVSCSQPLPAGRLDVLPMVALCMRCHYNDQNCRLGAERRS
jgi:RNA polymerase-binding transcription factor DksA